MAALTDEQLSAIVSTQIHLAKNHDRNEREKSRSKALDYYLGSLDAYVPPEVGRSKVVSRDVADTIGWMLPGIMRVFTASDRMAEAEPVGEEDQAFAREATDGMNYVFWKDNKGYEIVYNATWDALLVGNGVVKTYYDEYPIYTSSFHSGLSEDQLALLLEPDDDGEKPEVLAQSEKMVLTVDEATGQPIEAKSFDVKIKRKKAEGKFCIEVIPPEQFLIDQNAISTDEAAFTAHWERKARTELVEMGYDKDVIWSIPQSAKNQTPEESSRSPMTFDQEATDKSMDLVDYYECFIRIDVDDDGEAELVRACFAGSDSGKLLDWEVWEDEHPFDDIPCEPVPHRWDARSISDETMDVQDVKTVLLRQALNNVYAANNPQRFAKGTIKNMDELVSPTFGGVVIGEANAEIEDLAVPFVANHAFEAIAYQDEVVQRRTGVGRGTMALDPQALQNQTAEAVREGKDAGYSQVEMVARNMAEWGWRKVFRKLMRLMIKHQGERVIMMAGKPVKIDPRFWNADMDVTINVGLGTGSRDRDMSMLNVIMSTQAAIAARLSAIPGGQMKALEFIPKIMNAAIKLTESSGLRNPEHYFPTITADDMKAMAQAMQQASQQPDPKVQAEIQKHQAQLQIDAQKAQQDAALQQQKAVADIQLKREQLAAELELKREQLTAEITLKEALATREMNLKAASGYYKQPSVSTSPVEMGGQPG
ncbi:MAG: hypothetical protein E5X94_00670 [Mesorhizobium sp.]|uniref:portal protein n=2 Tax=unclassified Mesorhizobium TaxID=325217 RepID=UPI000FCAD567|nr:hypothetical protein [Mesorhizobium sp. M1A.F.Ca.IN.020.04.1.1]RUW04038.1 hypothetical protein EOA49_00480 [Mesorhizobium sp. M1A.F.Ca.IN.020.04.1.1]RUW04101.1 hypothetical protein EOA49_00815 [Mesorhizobium sp. M1A.F.Ca.IN.020.04.1.1]TIN88351.1 MAG: hypothetical protein E5X94_00670 [Mesorhizobium sp.]